MESFYRDLMTRPAFSEDYHCHVTYALQAVSKPSITPVDT